MGEFQPVELEVEEQNKTPIIKIGEVGAKLASKAGFLPSFLSSSYKYS